MGALTKIHQGTLSEDIKVVTKLLQTWLNAVFPLGPSIAAQWHDVPIVSHQSQVCILSARTQLPAHLLVPLLLRLGRHTLKDGHGCGTPVHIYEVG